ncbi:MAG: SDR family NAD(P)-dependent oxidoreductase [Acholeplasmatales bacterium]|jgi:short-subunit dehydrogenase|nr:SDR family NAD(P)-dependent oxidoreductase [Acholeplasmataceae bacterium]MCK9233931.1 SDR family NAD(P)-dependent oxidoreductase [Acholeplasmataceae bacterium]MCK9289229.1 SDR family NAD(P)-dependent oxidoreductase [Acholeplasmataceae bacterium]MDY0115294.1 SDR family NAD(P)-dependent oxidoreductase [Acholeplasmatales bacterium]
MIALITGGATGIGYGFARVFSDLGYDLILTSRNLNNLVNAKRELEHKYHNKVMIFVADLTKEADRKSLFNYTSNYSLDAFVNNAGRGLSKDFLEADFKDEEEIINLNVIAFQALLKHYLKIMVTNKSGRIINVSSLAGFFAGPGSATYYASKAYNNSLVNAIIKENKEKAVFIQLVCPGATKSNFHLLAKTKEKSYKYDPYIVAYKAVSSKKELVIPGFKSKLIYFFSKIIPRKIFVRLVYKRQLGLRL